MMTSIDFITSFLFLKVCSCSHASNTAMIVEVSAILTRRLHVIPCILVITFEIQEDIALK